MFGGCAFGLPWPRLAVCPFSVVRGCARQGFKSRGAYEATTERGIPRGPSRANKGGKGKIPCRQYFTFALTIAREFLRLIPGPTFYIKVHPGFRRKNAAAARTPRPNNSQRAFYFRETIYRKSLPSSSTGKPCFLPTLPRFISNPCFFISSRISFSPKSFVPSAFRKKGLHSSTSLSCASPMSGMPAYFSAIADTEASMKTLLAGSV